MKRLVANEIELETVDQGRGRPLVFVHGFPLDHTIWNAQVDELSGRYRVIAPDLRGFGASGVTEGTVTMDTMADDLAALLDSLGVEEPVVLCGLSMGGYVAWQFRRRHASRLGALVLCDTRAGADSPEAAAGRLATADAVIAEGPAALVEGMVPKLLAEATLRGRPQLVESVRKMMLATDPRGIAAAARGMAERPDSTELLAKIDFPTLVIVGRHDALSTVDQMRSMAEAIPGARLVEIAEAGHLSPLENPAAVNAALGEFLAGLGG